MISHSHEIKSSLQLALLARIVMFICLTVLSHVALRQTTAGVFVDVVLTVLIVLSLIVMATKMRRARKLQFELNQRIESMVPP